MRIVLTVGLEDGWHFVNKSTICDENKRFIINAMNQQLASIFYKVFLMEMMNLLLF